MIPQVAPPHSPILSDAEIDEICDGLTQDAAKVRYLRRLGLTVERKPNGRPLVLRSNLEAVKGARIDAQGSATPAEGQTIQEPDASALILHFKKKRGHHGDDGKKTEEQPTRAA